MNQINLIYVQNQHKIPLSKHGSLERFHSSFKPIVPSTNPYIYRIFGTPLSGVPLQTVQTHQHSITHDQHQPQEDVPATTNSLKEDEANCKRKAPC